uniref:Uncharacterized protein n=1 Tax=Streptomyces sp. F12 TaxID=1436084 RepID=V9Z8V2_9ACTN|nr:hypothetical protein pFRL6_347 [Streptomyces sp. F12]
MRVVGLHPGLMGELVDSQGQGLLARAAGFDEPGQVRVGRTAPAGGRGHRVPLLDQVLKVPTRRTACPA